MGVSSINGGSDDTYRVAAAIIQFAGGSTKYFGTVHAELTKIQPVSQTVFVDG